MEEKQTKKKKYRIGLVIGSVDEEFSNQICKGAMRASELLGDDLFIIPMKYLNIKYYDPNQDIQWEYQYNYLAAYAQQADLDLVIMSFATVACLGTPHQNAYLINNFGDTPIFMVASEDENYSSVSYDNKSGFIEGIEYLIKERNRKHLCLLSGPKSNSDAIERYNVFMDVMKKHNMTADDSVVAYGYFNEDCEDEVEDLLIRNPQADAIVCANDLMARTVYKVLKKYNFVIGEDICVMGFDNMEDSDIQEPPLASVSAQASALGYRAFIEAHRLLKEYGRENYPVVHYMEKTSFINRQSASGRYEPVKQLHDDDKKYFRHKIVNMESLDHKMNILARDMLMLESSSDQTYGSFLKALVPVEEIEDCYLFTFNKPIIYHANEDWSTLPDSIYLRAYKHGKNVIEVPSNKQIVKIKDIFSGRYLREEPKNYVLVDIFCREYQYGVMLCTVPYDLFHYVENLGYQLSIGLKIKELFGSKEKLLEERDDMLYILEKENNYLGSLSFYDELTGIFNRRGLNNQMMKYLDDGDCIGKRMVLIMADLNFLKEINDKFGHDEGDYALKNAAEAVSSSVSENGVACRIGGDEFVGLSFLDDEEHLTEIKRRIKKYLRDFNKTSTKPYEVKLSVGCAEFILDRDVDISEIMTKADQKLYEDKRRKGAFVIRDN